jgi:acyl-coenzyme A synthetase/AMP-(fatty) acid ligase
MQLIRSAAGRRDLQVQVRGNRVELEEMERCLDGHEAVAETGVYADEPDGNVRLVALVVARQAEVDAEELRRFCARLLPSAMIPAEVRFVGSLPRTPAGKLDQTRLEQHSSPDAPRTPTREAPHEH